MATSAAPVRQRKSRIDTVRAQIEKLKQSIAKDITQKVENLGITQSDAHALTGQAQTQFSVIKSGELRGFSLGRLIEIRALLGSAVTVRIADGQAAMVRGEIR